MKMRFTIDGSEALERRLAQTCERVREGVIRLCEERKLEALVLGGGYGRGQGGVLRTEAGELPYNDLEFYVFPRGNRLVNRKRYSEALNAFGEELHPAAGLHVEFKIDSLDHFCKEPVSMFSYDLVSGHRLIHGSESLFAGESHHRDAGAIPISEATRLLFNRCTGLLLAREILDTGKLSPPDADFVERNIAKAKLAAGDAVLTVLGQYHWDCRYRHERLLAAHAENAPEWARLHRMHAEGVDFKLHPRLTTKQIDVLNSEHEEVCAVARKVWLWVEGKRLNTHFESIQQYVRTQPASCPGYPAWRNLLLNIKTFGFSGLLTPMAWRYPRERLYKALAMLLWDRSGEEPEWRQDLQLQLRTGAKDWPGMVAVYKSIWPAYG